MLLQKILYFIYLNCFIYCDTSFKIDYYLEEMNYLSLSLYIAVILFNSIKVFILFDLSIFTFEYRRIMHIFKNVNSFK